ncbi:MAG: hypothetical protein N3A53_03820 [Verrucomicrobiae bacterium]|nr:hypothetical protein [Verrucomicrobiae bacterium]
MTLRLTDGSQLHGTSRATSLFDFTTELPGRLNIPVEKIPEIQFDTNAPHGTVILQNRDKFRGTLQAPTSKLTTLFDPVSIPVGVIRHVQVHALRAKGRPLGEEDWDALPFPTGHDWPGPRGEMSTASNQTILLRGHPIRTRRPVAVPFVWECEAECTAQGEGPEGTDLNFFFFPPRIERDEEPATAIIFRLSAQPGARGLTLHPALVELVGNNRQHRELWRGAVVPFAFGKPYRLRLTFDHNKVTVTLDDRTATVEPLAVELRDAHIQIWNWQPTSRWIVRNANVQ